LQVGFNLGRQGHDESAATTTNFLIANGMWSLIARSDSATRDVRFTWISPGFFATLGTPILAGRDIGPNDGRTSPKVVLVNEIFAHMFFPGSDPIGKTFRTQKEPDYPEADYEIVGLVRNTRYSTLQSAEPPMVYASASQFPPGFFGDMMFIRTASHCSASPPNSKSGQTPQLAYPHNRLNLRNETIFIHIYVQPSHEPLPATPCHG
jgi:MacB-like periplasmic core domain